MKKIALIALAGMIAVSVGACDHKVKPVAKPLSPAEQVQKAKNSKSLEERVTAIEERNARVDARARAAKKQFSPAPKYDPNFKG